MIQPEVGRLEFASDLRMVRASLVTMTETASKAIRAATTALLDLDLEAVRMTGSLEQELEDDMVAIERRTLHLLACQQPVAGDLRMLISAIKISADCRRMGALAHHIGTVASRRCSSMQPAYWTFQPAARRRFCHHRSISRAKWIASNAAPR